MKLAFVTPWYGEFAGGAEVAVRQSAEHLRAAGVDVEVLTTCVRTPFHSWWKDEYRPGEYELNGVTVKRFPVNRDGQAGYHEVNAKIQLTPRVPREEELRYLKGSISSDALVDYVARHRDERVFILCPYFYGLAYWTYKAAPDRCILMPCLHDEPQAHFSTTREMMEARKVIFLSPEERGLAQKLYGTGGDNFTVVGVGVDGRDTYRPGRFREKYGISGPYVLYVGRKDRGKNLGGLIDYFREYRKAAGDGLRLVLIGGGDRRMVPKQEHYVDLGYVDEDDKHDACAGALCTCLLSENESFSLVIMESWLAARPVVVSDRCAVTRGHCLRSNGGLFVADSDEFCEAIKYLTEHPDRAAAMGNNGKKYVQEHYAWEGIIRRYADIFKEFEVRGR